MFKNWHIAGALVIGMAGTAHAEEHMIVLTGFSYFPAVTYAKPGDTVRFINESGEEQTVVGKDAGWVVGPLNDQQEGTLVVSEETELAFFAAHGNFLDEDGDGENDLDHDNGSGNDDGPGNGNYGTYEDAPIRAEITFDVAPLNG
jgi:plastocyanin